jgi:adenomatosis polyposis coli protein
MTFGKKKKLICDIIFLSAQPSGSAEQDTGTRQSCDLHSPVACPSDSGSRSCVSPLNRSVDSGSAETAAQLMVASDGSWADHSDQHDDSASSKLQNKTSSVSEDVVTVLSRNGSLSSLSVDSFGSMEPTPSEQALLEQCISSGMPKSKSEVGCGKARLPVPVSTKKKVSSGVCKIPLAGERQVPVIPSMPVQKLELKPVVRTHCESSTDAMKTLENGMACLYVQDASTDMCSCDIRHGPKNGLHPSAAFNLKESAADVDENIAAIGGVQNLQDRLKNTSDLPENTGLMEAESHETVGARTVLNTGDKKDELQDSVECHLRLQYEDVKSDEDAFRLPELPEEGQCQPDMKVEISEDSSGVSLLSNKTVSPCESRSYGDKSPLSSGESPSAGFGSDEKAEDCEGNADSMAASLGRLTEEIVQQAQKERNRDSSIMKQSLIGSDTWNEDTSPNDVSFPSMSISAPLVASFRSDNHEDGAVTLPELAEERDVLSRTSEEQRRSSLTDTHMIEVEADRLAVAVQAEGQNLLCASGEDLKQSLTSLSSVDLDAIKPPSMMGSLVSLTASLSGQLDNGENGETREHCNSSSLPPYQPRNNGTRPECRHSRKRSLPVGMMVRRALGNGNHGGSIENLQDNTSISSSCNSHLDNIKPPSAMEELIDAVDMENSMVSVASITSEVADTSAKEQSASEQSPGNSDGVFELLKPVASVMAEVCAAAMCTSVRTSSASDCLDNINPPSAFSEFTDLADPESAMEPGTETICSDTELYTEEPGNAHPMDKLDEVDAPDLPSDSSMKASPLPPAHQDVTSSGEATPKKHRQLTPKQKRQLVKERYRTYTITCEDEHEEESRGKKGDDDKLLLSQPEVGEADSAKGPEQDEEKGQKKTTPKHRRLEDRQRFQTRVLDKCASVDTGAHEQEGSGEANGDSCLEEHPSQSINTDTVEPRTLKQKRAEAKERFQTRTLSEGIKPQPETGTGYSNMGANSSDAGFVEALLNVMPEEIESLLEHDANIVITTLNDSRRCNSESSELPSSDEMLLECETLSLISVESESDQNLNICKVGRRRESDLIGREPSVSEEPGMSDIGASEERVNQKFVDNDGEECQEEEVDDDDNDLPKTRGPRIVKPEERLRKDENADSNCTEDGTPQNNSPKAVRGRRKALYASPVVRKPNMSSPGLPVAGKVRSSIPVISATSNSGRSTRASVVRQTGRGTSQRSVSRTPPSSAESRSPRNASPKTGRTGRAQQRNSNGAKLITLGNGGSTCTSGGESYEHVAKDARFKPLERQGTFTKDEIPKKMLPPSPTKTRIPVPASVSSVPAKFEPKSKKTSGMTKQPHSVASTTSKIKIHKEKSAPVLTRSLGQSRFTKNCSQEISASGKGLPASNPKSLTKAATIPGGNVGVRSPPLSGVGCKEGSGGAQEGMKTSLSNQSLQSNGSGRATQQQGGAQPQRSTSNCSLNSVGSGGRSGGRKTGSKKGVTSKIASLWKRVEESKNKQKAAAKDTRVWITAAHNEADNVDSVVSTDVTPASRLVRSSTFEGLPSASAGNGEVDHNARLAMASKTMINVRFTKHDGKRESKGSRTSGDFTGFVANQDVPLKPSSAQRQVAEVTGVAIVQPTRKVTATPEPQHPNHSQEQIPIPEVILRRRRSGSENIDTDSEKPKRLSRLGSFIRIDPPGEEDEVVSASDIISLPRHPASAIVEPFNYCPPTALGSSHGVVASVAKRSESYLSIIADAEGLTRDQTEVFDERVQEFNTASMRITTV